MYRGAGGTQFALWPGSGVFKKKPKWVVAAELVETGRRYLRTAARINANWLEPLAGHLVKTEFFDPEWNGEAGAARCAEKVSLFGLPIVPRRTAPLAKYDPAHARTLFIQHGLLELDLPGAADGGGPDFLWFNRELQKEAEELQAKARDRDLLTGEEHRFRFYDERLPLEVTDLPRLNRWLKSATDAEKGRLVMDRSDVVRVGTAEPTAEQFPDAVRVGGTAAKLEYHLDPGTDRDGLTLTVRREDLPRLDPDRLGWLVPGLLTEKVTALIRGLPKELRRSFVPVPDTARAVVSGLQFGEGT